MLGVGSRLVKYFDLPLVRHDIPPLDPAHPSPSYLSPFVLSMLEWDATNEAREGAVSGNRTHAQQRLAILPPILRDACKRDQDIVAKLPRESRACRDVAKRDDDREFDMDCLALVCARKGVGASRPFMSLAKSSRATTIDYANSPKVLMSPPPHTSALAHGTSHPSRQHGCKTHRPAHRQ